MDSCRTNSARVLSRVGRRRCTGLIRTVAALPDPTMSRPSRARVCSTDRGLQALIDARMWHRARGWLQLRAAVRRTALTWVDASLRGWLVVLATTCACALASTTRALAQAPELSLRWQAPLGCPDQAEMETRVARALEDDTLRAKLAVMANVTETESGYRAQLSIQTDGGIGQRTLDNSRCDILADSVALVIALSANRSLGSASDASKKELVLAISAHASLVGGPLPRPAVGAGVGFALEGWKRLRWEINGSYYAEQTTTYTGLSIGADFRLLRVAARGCMVWSLGQLDVAPCLGAELYRIDGAGFGGMVERNGGSFVWGPELSTLVRLRVWRRLAVQLSAGATFAASRQRFTYGDLGLLHQPDALAYQLSLAPEVLF
jgi:hypothetical protein